nr:hypothetical protein [uncultured Albidiferax sp.]
MGTTWHGGVVRKLFEIATCACRRDGAGSTHDVYANIEGMGNHKAATECRVVQVEAINTGSRATGGELDASGGALCHECVAGIAGAPNQDKVFCRYCVGTGVLAIASVAFSIQKDNPAYLPVLVCLFAKWGSVINGVAHAHCGATVFAYGFGTSPQHTALKFIPNTRESISHDERLE